MDKLQQVFEQEFNTQIKRLIDEALSSIDISKEVQNTVNERFEHGSPNNMLMIQSDKSK